MQIEKWKQIRGLVKEKFSVDDEGSEHFDEDGGTDVEFLVFRGPLGLMRLEFETRPVVLSKKTDYSNRIGSETNVRYVYSDTEKMHKLLIFKWDDDADDWVEMEAARAGFAL